MILLSNLVYLNHPSEFDRKFLLSYIKLVLDTSYFNHCFTSDGVIIRVKIGRRDLIFSIQEEELWQSTIMEK